MRIKATEATTPVKPVDVENKTETVVVDDKYSFSLRLFSASLSKSMCVWVVLLFVWLFVFVCGCLFDGVVVCVVVCLCG